MNRPASLTPRTNGDTSFEPRRDLGRLAGILYAGMALVSALDLAYFPARFIVYDDASATAARIAAAPLLYRLWSAVDLTASVLAIYLAVTLYRLFEDVDRHQARVLAAMVLVQVPMWFALALTELAPLVLLDRNSSWRVFDKAQLDALALGSLRLFARGVGAIGAYWGLWLLPFGLLVYRCGFLPRILGILLLVSGAAYLLSALVLFVFPAYYHRVFWGAAPLYGLGEIGVVGWLLARGALREPT